FRPLVPIKKALKVELVRFWILRIVFGYLGRLSASNPRPQVVVNLFGDVSLNGNQIRHFPRVLIPPELGAVGNPDQIGLNRQSVPALRDPAHQYGVNIEFLTHFLGVDVSTLIAEYGAAGHY